MPRQRITKEILLECAYNLVKEKGFFSLSAKSLALAAHCSVQPIYSYFTNMDELKDYIYQKAGTEYKEFLEQRTGTELREKEKNPAIRYGSSHILFASQFPHLFFLLFQQTQAINLAAKLPHGLEGQFCLEILENNITLAFDHFEKEAAQGFFLFVHGTACALHSGLVKMDISLLDTFLKTQYLYLTKHNHSAEKKETSYSNSCFRGFDYPFDK